jgi:hypothetical protein
MPKTGIIKNKTGDAVQAVLENSMIKNPSIIEDQVFNEEDTSLVIKTITIEGNLEGYPSPLVVNVLSVDDCCKITVSYDQP